MRQAPALLCSVRAWTQGQRGSGMIPSSVSVYCLLSVPSSFAAYLGCEIWGYMLSVVLICVMHAPPGGFLSIFKPREPAILKNKNNIMCIILDSEATMSSAEKLMLHICQCSSISPVGSLSNYVNINAVEKRESQKQRHRIGVHV